MATTRAQGKALLTSTELALFESSDRSRIKAYTPEELKKRIGRVRFWDKYRQLAQQQQRKTKKSRQPGRPRPFSNIRTRQKAEVFAGALERFERRLEQLTREKQRKAGQAKPLAETSRRPVAQREAVHKNKQQRKAANESSLAPRVTRQFQKSKMRAIHGHSSGRGKRRQAKRDAR